MNMRHQAAPLTAEQTALALASADVRDALAILRAVAARRARHASRKLCSAIAGQ
ncbi:MAG: hypothetical protein JWN04_3836 [Myxococcaceae bacterium]|nr:hypothetical protein [Myxococcaceae bacterium]